jgi:ankyrin repeat protein
MFYRIVKCNILGIVLIGQFLKASYDSDEEHLYQAVKHGYTNTIDMYMQKNLNFSYINKQEGRTYLQCAIALQRPDIIQKFFGKVNINQQNQFFGETALHHAASKYGPNPEIVSLLLQQPDIDPTITNQIGYTPYQCAETQGHQEIMQLLQAHRKPRKFYNIQRTASLELDQNNKQPLLEDSKKTTGWNCFSLLFKF